MLNLCCKNAIKLLTGLSVNNKIMATPVDAFTGIADSTLCHL